MIELHLLRHAHAGDPGWRGTGPTNAARCPTRARSRRIGWGASWPGSGFRPDAIITSPKVRAAQTAEIVAGHLGVAVTTDERLGGALGIAELEAILRDAGDPARPVVVGHDPDFSELAATLSASPSMRKGAFARIDVERPLEPGGGTLRWLVPPDLLKPDR